MDHESPFSNVAVGTVQAFIYLEITAYDTVLDEEVHKIWHYKLPDDLAVNCRFEDMITSPPNLFSKVPATHAELEEMAKNRPRADMQMFHRTVPIAPLASQTHLSTPLPQHPVFSGVQEDTSETGPENNAELLNSHLLDEGAPNMVQASSRSRLLDVTGESMLISDSYTTKSESEPVDPLTSVQLVGISDQGTKSEPRVTDYQMLGLEESSLSAEVDI